jgi:hypothetical protein
MNKKNFLKIDPNRSLPLHYNLIEKIRFKNQVITSVEFVKDYSGKSYVNNFYKSNSHIILIDHNEK